VALLRLGSADFSAWAKGTLLFPGRLGLVVGELGDGLQSLLVRQDQVPFVVIFLARAQGAEWQNAGPPANPNASTPAVANPNANNPGAPAAGANSFTEGQAKSRIEAAGYSNISGLTKDKDGIWRGKASRGGATVDVGLDYQGNVVTR